MSKEQAIDPKLPPHDLKLEKGVMGCLLMGGPANFNDVVTSHPDISRYFYDLRNSVVFGAAQDLAEANQPIDMLSVRALLVKRNAFNEIGDAYINELAESGPAGGAAGYYADQLRELFIKRRTIAACATVESQARNGCNAEDLLETVERELNSICSTNAPTETSMKDLVRTAIDDIERAHANRGKPSGLTTGFSDLDRLTHGFRGGQFIVIGADTGAGKTSFALNICEHVALEQGLHVGVIELEMTSKELTTRLISSRSGVPLDRLLSGELREQDFALVTIASAAIAKAPLHIADQSSLKIPQLRAIARRTHRKHKLSLLVVDYLQLVQPSIRNPSRNIEVAEVSSSLKALAKELDVPLIALSQFNRNSASENRSPTLRDLRDSGSIEQDADIVGLLHRPDAKDEGSVELHIAKHRQGARRKLKLVFFGETFRFRTASV